WTTTVLFVAFAQTPHFRVVLYGLVGVVGVLVGLEIPLLLRLLRGRLAFSELVAQVLSLDYAGALLASLLFPLLLVPRLGLARTSAYQRIVLTRWTDDLRLFLNGHLQFSSRDEYRYHEALVHPAVAAHAAPRRVLVLGGGDGLAVREIVKYPAVQSVTLVDLD